MQIPSGLLVEQPTVAKREGSKSDCLACDLVETGARQFVIKAAQRVSTKPGPPCSQSGGAQHSTDPTLEGFQRGIEEGIKDLMERPVVIGRDDQMPARLQDTEDLAQRLCQ